jgi:agmatine/peptidylarginine deiminase
MRELERVTGAKQLVFVDSMIDEPTGHVDMYMTFVARRTVVIGQFLDKDEPNAEVLNRIADSLSNTIFEGEALKVVRVPMPPRRQGIFPERNTGIFRSFTNVVYLNGLLILPSYEGVTKDQEQAVRDIYAGLLPAWKIQFVDCSRPSQFGGALHCLVSNLGETPFLGKSQLE